MFSAICLWLDGRVSLGQEARTLAVTYRLSKSRTRIIPTYSCYSLGTTVQSSARLKGRGETCKQLATLYGQSLLTEGLVVTTKTRRLWVAKPGSLSSQGHKRRSRRCCGASSSTKHSRFFRLRPGKGDQCRHFRCLPPTTTDRSKLIA